jgi:spermidine/putrescine transport system substrate-binding protein
MRTPLNYLAVVSLVGVFGLVVSGCREKAPAPPRDVPHNAQEASAPDGDGARPLVILTWDQYFSDDVISKFEEESGIPVEFVVFENLDEMAGLLRSRPSDFDLVLVDGGTLADLIELQLVQPIDRSLIPGFSNLDETFIGTKFDPENTFSVPYMWGTTLVVYRSDKIAEPRKSWSSLWDEQYRDRALMLDDKFDIYAAALLAGGSDINTRNAAEISRATERLLEQADKLNVRFVDIFEIREKLLSGDCWIAMTYSSDAAVLAEAEEDISYFIPDEGAPLWVDSFVIPRESTNQEAAHRFLEYFCRPEVAAANSNELWSASANKGARPLISKEVLDDPTIYVSEEVFSRCRLDNQTSPERQLLTNQGLKEVFDRVRNSSDRPRLSLLAWNDYIDPEVVAKFEKECNARLLVTEVDNSEQLKQELASAPDRYDVVVTDEQTLLELIQLKLLKELSLPESDAPPVKSETFLASLSDPGNQYSVPYLWGLTVIAGKTKLLEGGEPSWNLIWREDLRIGLLDEPVDLIWIGLLTLGYNPAEATPAQVEEAAARIGKRFPDLKRDMRDLASGLDALEADEIDLLITYNGDAIGRAEKNPAIRAVVPKEGAPLWVDSFAIPRDAPSPELASRFIHFMTTPESSALSANALRYASPNPAARELLEPRLLSNKVLYPGPELSAKCRFVRYEPDVEKAVRQAVVGLVSGDHPRKIAMGEEEETGPASGNREAAANIED